MKRVSIFSAIAAIFLSLLFQGGILLFEKVAQAGPIDVKNIKSIEYPGPDYAIRWADWSAVCYQHTFKDGCFNATAFRSDMETIKSAGFNTVWIPSFWGDFSSEPGVYKDIAFANLNQALGILAELDMTLLTSPQYEIQAYPWYWSPAWLIDDAQWSRYKTYVAEFSR